MRGMQEFCDCLEVFLPYRYENLKRGWLKPIIVDLFYSSWAFSMFCIIGASCSESSDLGFGMLLFNTSLRLNLTYVVGLLRSPAACNYSRDVSRPHLCLFNFTIWYCRWSSKTVTIIWEIRCPVQS